MVRQAAPDRLRGALGHGGDLGHRGEFTAGDPGDLGVTGWSRSRLVAVLLAIAAAAMAVVVGLVLVVASALGSPSISDGETAAGEGASPSGSGIGSTTAADGDRRAVRDAAASRPMTSVDEAAARGGVPAPVAGPTIEIGPATRTGPADVPSGFDQSLAGAVGQLGAIVTTVLQAMSIEGVGEVHAAWVMPGGPGVEQWRMTGNVQAFLGRANQSAGQSGVQRARPAAGAGGGTGASGFDVRVLPAAAQIKAVDGPDWVLACVLVEVTAVITTTARIGYGHCERMQWDAVSQRWMIGPGAQPARAPSTWPGTELSYAAGWRTWLTAPSTPAPSPAPTPTPATGG